MDPFIRLIEKAARSSFYRRILNIILWKKIPFNWPHRIVVTEILPDGFVLKLPYKRQNLNHLRGIHACGLATLSEYVAGLTLLRKIGSKHYRIIMQEMHMSYRYQGRKDVFAQFELTDDWVQSHVLSQLESNDAIFVELSVMVKDADQKHICTGMTKWQIKKWNKIRDR
ncbi:MAG: DUF4442 domain-containing protein [Flavobacteriales bacterium]|nr:DUF4442 domain-containing protein [Flavobacteriales bacterium]